jgi:polyhydroxyalkanoate synthesis regulator phasin
MEIYLRSMNLPTRSEVDEIHRTIYELRKEVKSLKKALGEKKQ